MYEEYIQGTNLSDYCLNHACFANPAYLRCDRHKLGVRKPNYMLLSDLIFWGANKDLNKQLKTKDINTKERALGNR